MFDKILIANRGVRAFGAVASATNCGAVALATNCVVAGEAGQAGEYTPGAHHV